MGDGPVRYLSGENTMSQTYLSLIYKTQTLERKTKNLLSDHILHPQ